MRLLQIKREKDLNSKTALVLWTSNCTSTQTKITLCIVSTVQRQGVFRVCSQKGFFLKTARKLIYQRWKKLSGNTFYLKHVWEMVLKRCYSGNRGQIKCGEGWWSPGDELCVESQSRALITASLCTDTQRHKKEASLLCLYMFSCYQSSQMKSS